MAVLMFAAVHLHRQYVQNKQCTAMYIPIGVAGQHVEVHLLKLGGNKMHNDHSKTKTKF